MELASLLAMRREKSEGRPLVLDNVPSPARAVAAARAGRHLQECPSDKELAEAADCFARAQRWLDKSVAECGKTPTESGQIQQHSTLAPNCSEQHATPMCGDRKVECSERPMAASGLEPTLARRLLEQQRKIDSGESAVELIERPTIQMNYEPTLARRFAEQQRKIDSGASAVEHIERPSIRTNFEPTLARRFAEQQRKIDSGESAVEHIERPTIQTSFEPALARRLAEQQQKIITGESAVERIEKRLVLPQFEPALERRLIEQQQKIISGESAVECVSKQSIQPHFEPTLARRLAEQQEKIMSGESAVEKIEKPTIETHFEPELARRFAEQQRKIVSGESAVESIEKLVMQPRVESELARRMAQQREKCSSTASAVAERFRSVPRSGPEEHIADAEVVAALAAARRRAAATECPAEVISASRAVVQQKDGLSDVLADPEVIAALGRRRQSLDGACQASVSCKVALVNALPASNAIMDPEVAEALTRRSQPLDALLQPDSQGLALLDEFEPDHRPETFMSLLEQVMQPRSLEAPVDSEEVEAVTLSEGPSFTSEALPAPREKIESQAEASSPAKLSENVRNAREHAAQLTPNFNRAISSTGPGTPNWASSTPDRLRHSPARSNSAAGTAALEAARAAGAAAAAKVAARVAALAEASRCALTDGETSRHHVTITPRSQPSCKLSATPPSKFVLRSADRSRGMAIPKEELPSRVQVARQQPPACGSDSRHTAVRAVACAERPPRRSVALSSMASSPRRHVTVSATPCSSSYGVIRSPHNASVGGVRPVASLSSPLKSPRVVCRHTEAGPAAAAVASSPVIPMRSLRSIAPQDRGASAKVVVSSPMLSPRGLRSVAQRDMGATNVNPAKLIGSSPLLSPQSLRNVGQRDVAPTTTTPPKVAVSSPLVSPRTLRGVSSRDVGAAIADAITFSPTRSPQLCAIKCVSSTAVVKSVVRTEMFSQSFEKPVSQLMRELCRACAAEQVLYTRPSPLLLHGVLRRLRFEIEIGFSQGCSGHEVQSILRCRRLAGDAALVNDLCERLLAGIRR